MKQHLPFGRRISMFLGDLSGMGSPPMQHVQSQAPDGGVISLQFSNEAVSLKTGGTPQFCQPARTESQGTAGSMSFGAGRQGNSGESAS